MILSWNGRDDTLEALRSVQREIAASTAVCRAGAIVVDNGSSDGTEDAVAREFPGVRLIRLRENRGFTGGVKAGLAISTADYGILLNNDATADPGWLAALVGRIHESPPDVIAAAGKIVDPAGTHLDFGGGILTFDGHAFQRDFRKALSAVEELPDGAELLFACGGNMVVRRAEFAELGGFDDDYFAYLEDVDFGWRAWLSGRRIVYARDAVVRHKSSATSDRLGAFERGVLFERNALATALKNYDRETLASMSGPLFLTLLHRIHHYTARRGAGTEELRRPPLGGTPAAAAAPESRLARMRRRVARLVNPRAAATIEDPHAVMQFRAIEWFFENQDRLMAKRAAVQARRTRSDAEIFSRFPLFYIPTYPGDAGLMSSALFELLKPSVPSESRQLEEIMQL